MTFTITAADRKAAQVVGLRQGWKTNPAWRLADSEPQLGAEEVARG